MSRTFINTGSSLTIYISGDIIAVPRSHKFFDKIVEALSDPTVEDREIFELIEINEKVVSFTRGRIEARDRQLFLDGYPLNSNLARKILDLLDDDQEIAAEALIKFLERVMNNPSRRAVDGLYDWLVRGKMPILDDGRILAFKIVADDYYDIYTRGSRDRGDFSRSFRHAVGDTPEMPRHRVDEDADVTCSYGLHFCSPAYLPCYGTESGSRIMTVAVDPADVVAFPRDHNVSKGRACKLEVLSEVDREKAPDLYKNANVISTEQLKADHAFRELCKKHSATALSWFVQPTPRIGLDDDEQPLFDDNLIAEVMIEGVRHYKLTPAGKRVYNELTKPEQTAAE